MGRAPEPDKCLGAWGWLEQLSPSLPLFVSLSLTLPLSLTVFVFLCVCLSVSFSLFLPLSLSHSLLPSLYLPLCLSPSSCMSILDTRPHPPFLLQHISSSPLVRGHLRGLVGHSFVPCGTRLWWFRSCSFSKGIGGQAREETP